MEYILFLTYRCNLTCKYCFAKNFVHNETKNQATISTENIIRFCKYIEKDISINNRQNNSIVFFGGEPSLVPEIILDIIERTSHLNLKYSIYTNGLLLDRFPDSLLKKLQTILVAIDGDKVCHEIYKPKGSYDLILTKVQSIKAKTAAQIIARITMEEETNINLSVSNLLNHFDFVHWQIVNKNIFNNPAKLIENYRQNIKLLFDKWKQSLKEGIVLNIIPFNQIVYSLITNKTSDSFRCGCGSSIQAIDINGNIYLCDEFIENKDNIVANIQDENYHAINYKSHTELFDDCKNCEISTICLGRCRKCLETQSSEQIRTYCELTKILIYLIIDSLEEIKDIIKDQKISIDSLQKEIYSTEIIP